jgi:hypothetical protein
MNHTVKRMFSMFLNLYRCLSSTKWCHLGHHQIHCAWVFILNFLPVNKVFLPWWWKTMSHWRFSLGKRLPKPVLFNENVVRRKSLHVTPWKEAASCSLLVWNTWVAVLTSRSWGSSLPGMFVVKAVMVLYRWTSDINNSMAREQPR